MSKPSNVDLVELHQLADEPFEKEDLVTIIDRAEALSAILWEVHDR